MTVGKSLPQAGPTLRLVLSSRPPRRDAGTQEMTPPVIDVVAQCPASHARHACPRLFGSDFKARQTASLMPVEIVGLTMKAPRSSAAAPANSLRTSRPVRLVRAATYSLATRFTSRHENGVTNMMSAGQVRARATHQTACLVGGNDDGATDRLWSPFISLTTCSRLWRSSS